MRQTINKLNEPLDEVETACASWRRWSDARCVYSKRLQTR